MFFRGSSLDLFSSEEIAGLSGGVIPPAPKDYVLPSQFPPIHKATRVALDFETHDPDIKTKGPGWRRDAYPVGIAVAAEWRDNTTFAEYYPIAHRNGLNLSGEKVFEWLADELAFYSGTIVGANLLYENDGLQCQGVLAPSAKWKDVQWAEALLDENAFSYKLNTLAKNWLGETKVTEELKELYGPDYIERFREVHPGHARAYGLGDVMLPLRILEKQEKQLAKEHMTDLWNLECRLMPFLVYMRQKGVRVDLKAAEQLGDMMIAKRDAALKECSKRCGLELNAENFNKPSVIGMALDRLGIKYPLTPTGRPSIKDAWLDNLDDPFGEQLAIANQCNKAYGTFVDGYVSNFQINGRVHCEFHPLRKVDDESGKSNGTVTGRFSSVHPNLQNIPTRDEIIGPLCRALFIADEGADWWCRDYSQIEYRFLVHYAVEKGCEGAGKPQAMYIKNPGTDFHEMCAELVWVKEWAEVTRALAAGEINKATAKARYKKIRVPAKNLNFGLVYGMGVDKLANTLGMVDENGKPTQEAMDLMGRYHAGAPFIKDLNSKCTDEAARLGYTSTILNRRRRFNLWEPKFTPKDADGKRQFIKALPLEAARAAYGDKLKRSETHKSLNARLQGSAADLMKQAMVDCWEAGIFDDSNDITCVLTVHDELNGSVLPTERGKKALAEVQYRMEHAMTLHVPVLTDGKTGRNWSEAK
jgi:DNA polymerase I-like protein with 3'-5' exonuclease and polymerase domains